jgi:hypothetical protein
MLKYNILLAVRGMKSPFYLGNAGLSYIDQVFCHHHMNAFFTVNRLGDP